jgi:hypothetical protein
MVACESDRNIYEQEGYDQWFQAPNNDVDILWVVDDSCSMSDEQDTLTKGFSSFTHEMAESGTDFHIGLITTSFDYTNTARGMLIGDPPFLTPNDDYIHEFALRATVGIDGSDKEKGLEASSYAVSPSITLQGLNEGFIRSNAHLLVVVVSDEDDCSDYAALEGQPPQACYTEDQKLVPVQEIVQDFRALKDDPDDIQIGAIVGQRGSSCPDVYPGQRYIEAAAYTGGIVGDICESDWSSLLTELGLNAVGIRTSFQLTASAKLDSLVVSVDGEELEMDERNGWTYDDSTCYITFNGDSVPERDSEIVATYTVQSGGACI